MERKPNRLKDFDYNQPGSYFITFCTQNRRCILSHIVGGGAHDAPHVELTAHGQIVAKYILSGNRTKDVFVEKYVIMPNHVHMILTVRDARDDGTPRANSQPGRRGRRPLQQKAELRPSPTNQAVPRFVSTLKRLCHAEMGEKIFQRSFYDHVIRNEDDWREIAQYIENNPAKWAQDKYYV